MILSKDLLKKGSQLEIAVVTHQEIRTTLRVESVFLMVPPRHGLPVFVETEEPSRALERHVTHIFAVLMLFDKSALSRNRVRI